MGERARRRSGKRSGQRMAPRQRTGGRVASPRSESRFLSAACACGRTGEPGDAQHASEREAGAAKAVRRQRRRLGGGVAHFGREGVREGGSSSAVGKGSHVPRHFGNNFTSLPSHPLFRVVDVGCSESEAHSNGRQVFASSAYARRNTGTCRATARISVQGLPTADARKPVGKFAVRRHHPPHSVEKPERRLPDALDASCSSTLRTQSASFGRLRIQPSGRSCRRACVA